MAANRRAVWLGGMLAVAIVGAIVVRSTDDAQPATAARTAQRDGASRNAAAKVASAPLDVKLEALQRDRGEPRDLGRNPFQFRAKPAPPAPPVITPPVNQTVDPVVPVAPAGPPPPPPIPLKFIGVVQKVDGTKIAVLSDGRGPIWGYEGGEIEGRYKILKIGLESIELSYIDGRGRQTIRLSGQ